MTKRRRAFRDSFGGVAAFVASVLLAAGAGAQDYSALDRTLGKANPSAELVANFNELVSAAANVGAVPPTESDRAAADAVRATLQDPGALARAKDPTARTAAQSGAEFQQIPGAAAKLDQAIGSRLSADARKGMSTDFTAVAEYMAIVSPGSNWYCQIRPLGALVGC
ncbi:MAG: hypothetical protein ABUL54_00955 [Dongia sp.]